MFNVLQVFASIILLVIALYFIVKPRIIRDAWWYGTLHEPVNLYIIPPVCVIGSLVMITSVVEDVTSGIPGLLAILAILVGVPSMLLLGLGIFAYAGMPMPRFLMPKWVYERKVRDRDDRGHRRSREKDEKQRV